MTTAIKINANDGKTRNVMSGGETEVDFDFPIFDATHLAVYETDTNGDITLLVKDTDYTVPAGSVNQQAGGTIDLDATQYPSGATASHVFTVYQDAPNSRTTDFNQAGDFFADTLNQELDLIAQQLQQLTRDLNRAPLAPVDTTLTALTLPEPSDGFALVWDGVVGAIRNTASSIENLEGDAETVADNIASVNTVAGIDSEVTTVAGISGNVTTTAGIAANVTTVANISANVTTVAGISANVTTVAGDSSDIQIIAPISADIQTLADIEDGTTATGAIQVVAAIDSNVTTVADISANVTTVAAISADVTTVSGNSANITTVADDITNVNTVAANIVGVNSFANRYRIESSDPATSLDEGDLVFNTTDKALKYYNGTSWQTIAPGISNVVEDTTPQLGGMLDVNGNAIVSTSNGNIAITPNGTGKIVLDGLNWPTADGTADQVMKTDGAGNVSFGDAGGGGWVPIQTQTVSSAVASVDFTSGIDSTYKAYALVATGVKPSNDSVSLYIRVGNGSFDAGASDYGYNTQRAREGLTTIAVSSSASASAINLSASEAHGNAAGENVNINMYFGDWSDTNSFKTLFGSLHGTNTGSDGIQVDFLGFRSAVGALDRLQFYYDAGNITAGTFTLYGLAGA